MSQYKGRLGKKRKIERENPFKRKMQEIFASEIEDQKRKQENSKEIKENLELLALLFDHYGLNKGDWFGLSLALARDHVPAFQFDKRHQKGGSNKVPIWDDWRVIGCVQELIEKGEARDVRHSCLLWAESDLHEVKKRAPPGQENLSAPRLAGLLEERYKNACKRIFNTKSIPSNWRAEFGSAFSDFQFAANAAERMMKSNKLEFLRDILENLDGDIGGL